MRKIRNLLSDNLQDEKYMQLLVTQPTKALEILIDKYASLVKTVASGIIGAGNVQDVEECISDVFVKLWKNADKFDMSKGSLKSYLISITRFTAIDYIRKNSPVKMQLPLDEEALQTDHIHTETEAINSINSSLIRDAIEALEPTDRDIFIKRYYDCLSVNEIVRTLGLDKKFVENRLYRGKKILEKNLIRMGVII